ncbi:hypothetical protein, partial [Burkholderia sp. KCJ3K979]|uniref:hypothetical protein n=1 Tax=Burkholderia sp. KCJ3K979 TaxID=2759149 RepID=UPI001F29FB98
QASLGFLQDADDLFFGESLFHCRSSLERTLHRHRTKRGEQVTSTSRQAVIMPISSERDRQASVARRGAHCRSIESAVGSTV